MAVRFGPEAPGAEIGIGACLLYIPRRHQPRAARQTEGKGRQNAVSAFLHRAQRKLRRLSLRGAIGNESTLFYTRQIYAVRENRLREVR